MTADSIKQLQRELQTKTREEVWRQITYITRAARVGSSRAIKKIKKIEKKRVMRIRRTKTASVLDSIGGDPIVEKITKPKKPAGKAEICKSSVVEMKVKVRRVMWGGALIEGVFFGL